MRDPEFDAAVIRKRQSLLNYAMSLCKNVSVAEDMVQDTMIRALTNWEQYTPDTNLGGWLFTILRNNWLSFMRKSVREVEDVDDSFANSVSVKASQHDAVELRETMNVLKTLPKEFRDAIRIIAIEGCDYETASARLGVPIGTVKSRVSRARVALETGEGVAPSDDPPPTDDDNQVEDLFQQGLSASEIAAKIPHLSRVDVLNIIATRRLTRRRQAA